MRDRLADLGDAEVAVVLFTRQRNLRGYRSRFVAPLTVLTDEDRSLYRAYGLGRGPVWRVFGPSAVRRELELVARGRRQERPTEDVLQLGGDFVVGRDGKLVYVFRSKSPDDRPSVDELVAAVAGKTPS